MIAKICFLTVLAALVLMSTVESMTGNTNSANCKPPHLSQNHKDCRIYSFAFTGVAPGSFFDGEILTGTRVELTKEVCCRANKRCVFSLVPFGLCLDGNTLSQVLDHKIHDACTELSDTPRRNATYAFSDITYWNLSGPAIIVRSDSIITLADLQNPDNNFTLAVMSGAGLTTSAGLMRYLDDGFFVKDENILMFDSTDPNVAVDGVVDAVNDANDTVVGVVGLELINPNDTFKVLKILGDQLGRVTLMVRKDNQRLLEWFDYYLKEFMCSPEYDEFCDRMDEQFGANPVNCPDKAQVDCSECFFRRRTPFCDPPGNGQDNHCDAQWSQWNHK